MQKNVINVNSVCHNFVLDGDPVPPPQKGNGPQNFWPMFIVAKRLDGWRWYLAWRKSQPRRLGVRWRPTHPSQKGAQPPPQFSAHFYCGQTTGCIKMPLGMEVGLSPGDFVLVGDPARPTEEWHPTLLWPRSPISATAELLFFMCWLFISRCHVD